MSTVSQVGLWQTWRSLDRSSVNWWNTLHQPGSISWSGTSIHIPMPIPILSNFANFPLSTRILFVLETCLHILSFLESPLRYDIEAREGIAKPSLLPSSNWTRCDQTYDWHRREYKAHMRSEKRRSDRYYLWCPWDCSRGQASTGTRGCDKQWLASFQCRRSSPHRKLLHIRDWQEMVCTMWNLTLMIYSG